MEKIKLLVINPHPDDEAFFFGGTISKYASEGFQVYVLTLTNGEKGKLKNSYLTSENINNENKENFLGNLRKKELINSLVTLGVPKDNLFFANISNLAVDQHAISKIMETVRFLDPHVVISFNEAGTSRFTNQDHSWSAIATYYALITIIRELKDFRRYLTYVVPKIEDFFDEFNEIHIEEKYFTNVDVYQQIKSKKSACRKHKSQDHLLDYFTSVGFLDVQQETYLERLNLCKETSQGKDSIFFGINGKETNKKIPIENYVKFPIPMKKNSYNSSSSVDIYKEILSRSKIAEKYIED